MQCVDGLSKNDRGRSIGEVVMPLAACLIHTSESYRRKAFVAGLEAVGYTVTDRPSPQPQKDELILVWNRSAYPDKCAKRYEAVGATVLVTENGWIGSAPDGHKLYALQR